ncbi:class I SAM-dependent methyltransferase [Nocardia asteroides]|uniref:class I SAM-dependent methyltransferase n=1 Tax=Nocardia asteroides TaxID=1824 RepID=UPI001E4BC824|nr:class I SAM-dependent methyltransferase [Nocardia asteroides]UGT63911.1 class I SAM-dependent methyltransferase [Nocardia asteroides]
MPSASLWEHTLTFFPQFLRVVADECPAEAVVTVVGASDGKFVLPLASVGHRVVAIDSDQVALNGGEVLLPHSGVTYAPGLVERLADVGLTPLVRVVCADFLDTEPADLIADAVWTSCSWHYSANHERPLGDFVSRMQQVVRPGGVFGAEFMMPFEYRHEYVEHYTTPDRLTRYFDRHRWTVLLRLQTDTFTERAHVGRLHDHQHRMGLLIAKRHPEEEEEGGTRQR